MASLWDIGDYLYDTWSGGKGTTDKSSKEIEEQAEQVKKAGDEYSSSMQDIARNTKSAKQLYNEGKEIASAQANNKAGIAAKNAKAASMQTSGSKLMSAIQAAEAANKASQEGYDTGTNTALNAGLSTESMKNQALSSGAQGKLSSANTAANMNTQAATLRAQQAQQRSLADKNRAGQIGAAFIGSLSNGKV